MRLYIDRPKNWAQLKRNPWILLACLFGFGLIKPAPGTWGSLGALLLALGLLPLMPPASFPALIIGFYALGVIACEQWEAATGRHDDGRVVIDELVGLWIGLLPLLVLIPDTQAIGLWAAAFALFRFFDIIKPWPIGWIDRRVAGGHGVMLDDVVAGIMAALALILLRKGLGYV